MERDIPRPRDVAIKVGYFKVGAHIIQNNLNRSIKAMGNTIVGHTVKLLEKLCKEGCNQLVLRTVTIGAFNIYNGLLFA